MQSSKPAGSITVKKWQDEIKLHNDEVHAGDNKKRYRIESCYLAGMFYKGKTCHCTDCNKLICHIDS